MKLNKNDLKKIQYDFNSYSNRLLQADFQDYLETLRKFLRFIGDTPIIIDYVHDCGNCDWDLGSEVKAVQESYGRLIFLTGDTEEEEVRNIFAMLSYLAEINNDIYDRIAWGYSSSKAYQDKIKGFNSRFVRILIDHIERYLTKIGIDMGLDEKMVYNVTVKSGQAIIANENSTVVANNSVGLDINKLESLIQEMKVSLDYLPEQEQESASECIEVIEAEATSTNPRKSMIRMAVNTLQAIKGTTEFAAAAVALTEFISPLLG